MAGRSTWWRRLGATLAALALVVLTFGPSLDSLLCHDEAGLQAAAAEQTVASNPDAEAEHPAADGSGLCVHGHCHHAAPFLPADAVRSAEPASHLARHTWARATLPSSAPKFGLKRPPRA